MINRRHLRIKVMQSLYAYRMNPGQGTDANDTLLKDNIFKMHELYLIHLSLLAALRRKSADIYRKTEKLYLKNRLANLSSPHVMRNRLLMMIDDAMSHEKNEPATFWQDHFEMLEILWLELVKKRFYKKYIRLENPGFEDDKQFVTDLFRDFLAPHERLYRFYTDSSMGWADDFAPVNTRILQQILQTDSRSAFKTDVLFKFPGDLDFAVKLLARARNRYANLENEIARHTPNWDKDRITLIDRVLLVLALTEFLDFPLIPVKVSINEYVEISKDYATEKSGVFINGVLDKFLTLYREEGKIVKTGKGLQ